MEVIPCGFSRLLPLPSSFRPLWAPPRRSKSFRRSSARWKAASPSRPALSTSAAKPCSSPAASPASPKSPEDKIRLAYSVQAFDPKGVPIAEIYKNEISSEVLPQDKEWQPKIELAVPTPPLVPPGAYKIVVKVDDLEAKTSAELAVPFHMRGPVVEPSDKLVVRAFRFYTAEDDAQPMAKAAYHVGDDLWAKFDITGFKYGPNNKVDISYVVSILNSAGAVLWKQPEPALEQSESFYPKPYVQASMNLNLKTVKPAEYTMLIQVKDAVGNQTCEIRQTFTVQ